MRFKTVLYAHVLFILKQCLEARGEAVRDGAADGAGRKGGIWYVYPIERVFPSILKVIVAGDQEIFGDIVAQVAFQLKNRVRRLCIAQTRVQGLLVALSLSVCQTPPAFASR